MLQSNALNALLSHPVFVEISASRLATLGPALRLVSPRADAVLFRPGEPAAEVFFIVAGEALRFGEGPDGAAPRGTLPFGDVAGVDAVFGQTARSEGVLARAGCRAVAVTAEALLSWLGEAPGPGLGVLLRLGELMSNQAAATVAPGPDVLSDFVGSGRTLQVLTVGAPGPLLCQLEAVLRGPDGAPVLQVRCHPDNFPRPVPGLIPWAQVSRLVWEP